MGRRHCPRVSREQDLCSTPWMPIMMACSRGQSSTLQCKPRRARRFCRHPTARRFLETIRDPGHRCGPGRSSLPVRRPRAPADRRAAFQHRTCSLRCAICAIHSPPLFSAAAPSTVGLLVRPLQSRWYPRAPLNWCLWKAGSDVVCVSAASSAAASWCVGALGDWVPSWKACQPQEHASPERVSAKGLCDVSTSTTTSLQRAHF
mmetsp:Transcript_54008/g.136935  ORF Transcript_54008/g.136935 Transcript_54008/m.136935 type:complete len:204 (-) Transcript_54008:71-682(-)